MEELPSSADEKHFKRSYMWTIAFECSRAFLCPPHLAQCHVIAETLTHALRLADAIWTRHVKSVATSADLVAFQPIEIKREQEVIIDVKKGM